MTSPKHAREIKGKGRYYGSCGEGCPFGDQLLISVTNAQSVINKPALPPSAAKVTAETAWELLPRMVAVSRQGPDGNKGCHKARVADRCGQCRFCINAAIKAEYKAQWESKADLGTRVHGYAHAHVVGQPMPFDEDVDPFIDQYLEFLDRYGVDLDRDIEAAETTVLSRKHGYAGTGDVWLWLTINGRRQLILTDIKTSLTKPATAVYPDQVLQLAGLRYAESAVLPDDTEMRLPKFDGAAILNLRTNSHALIPLPADENAYGAFLAAVRLQTYFHDLDTRAWTPLEAPALPEPKTRRAA